MNANKQWQIYGNVEQAKKDIDAVGATTTNGRPTNSTGTNLLPTHKYASNLKSGVLGTALHAR